MFEKLLTSIGIGNLTVNTILEKTVFNENEPIKGKIVFKGGKSDVEINYIKLSLIERINNEGEDSDFAELDNNLQEFEVHKTFVIEKDSIHEHEFEFKLEQFELKDNTDKLYLKTHVYIEQSVDSEDEDELTIIR